MDSFVAAFAPSLRGRGASEPTRATVHRNHMGASVLSEGKYFFLSYFASHHFVSRGKLHQLSTETS